MNLSAFTSLLSRLPIKDRLTHEVHPFRLFHNQTEAVHRLAKQQEDTGKIRAIFLKSRRVGISSLADGYLFCDALALPHRENLIVAHMKDTAEGLFRVPRDLAKAINEVASVCTIQTKSVYVNHREGDSVVNIATAGTVASGRGLSLSNLHLSEAAYSSEGSFLSLLPAVAEGPNTAVFVESTANGVTDDGEPFYDFWQSAVERRSEYIAIFLGWLTDPGCVAESRLARDAPATDLERELMAPPFNATRAQIAWMRITLESKCQGYEKKFLQEYPHDAGVAFQATGDPAFTTEELNFSRTTLQDPPQRGFIEWKDHPVFTRTHGGALAIWEEPKEGHRYYIGMDAAVGVEEGDFAAISVWDGTTGRQAAQYADRVVPEVVADVMRCLGHWYNRALTNGELTGNSGREVLRIMRDHYHYPNFAVWRGKDDKIFGFSTNKRPVIWWETTAYSRQKMFDCFRLAVRGGMKKEAIEKAIVRDPALWAQMSRASLSDSGRWELRKGHDDILVSAMLAIVALAQNPVPRALHHSALIDIGESEEDSLKKVIPTVIDDATLSLGRHYSKVMKLLRKGPAMSESWRRELVTNKLVGV